MFRDLSFNFGLASSEDLRLRHSEPPRFSGAAVIAQVLDPTNRRLTDLLGSGSARNLTEAFQQLNPSEQNVLRERWGRSLDELISLSSERDATIFHHGLLEVGHRLEDADQLELAGVVYSSIVASPSPLGLRPSSGGGEGARRADEGTAPAGILARAQSRLNAMSGVGDWRTRLAFNLERLPTNATRWDMLFAMGGAGLVFRGVRLAATARWASSFESAFALNATATSSAFLAETAAFTGFGRLFGTMAGNHYDWSAEGTFNEWAGGAAMLLGLKAMGGIFGNLSERWAAGETAFARVTRAVAPQAGMFSGIVLGNRLAELGGFHPERHGDTWLTDGLTTLLEFNIAGRLQRGAGGPGLTNLEGRMEAYTRALGRSGRARWAELFSPSGLSPEGVRVRVPHAASPEERALQETTVFSVSDEGNGSDGNGPPGSRPKGNSSLSTLPFGVPVESLRDPSRAMFSQDLLRRMSDPEYGFVEQLRKNKTLDLTLDNVLSNPDLFAKSVVETLDRLTDIEDLARVNVLLPRSSERMAFRKFQGTWRYTGTFPEGAPVESTTTGPTETPDAKSQETLPTATSLPVSEPQVAPAELAPSEPSSSLPVRIPIFFEGYERLPIFLKMAAARAGGRSPLPVIVEIPRGAGARSLDPEFLNQLTGHLSKEMPVGALFEVLEPQRERSWLGTTQADGLFWGEGRGLNHAWTRAAISGIRTNVEVQDATELFQLLFSYSRDQNRNAETVNQLVYRGTASVEAGLELRGFVLQILNQYGVRGRQISFQVGGETYLFETREGSWGLRFHAETAPVVPVLEAPPAETTPAPIPPPENTGEASAASGREPTSPFLKAVRLLGGAAPGEAPPSAREAPEFRWVSTTTAFSNHVEELFKPEFENNPMVVFMDRGTALAARDTRTIGERLERALLTSVTKSRRMLVHDLRGKKTFQFVVASEKVDVTVEAWRRPENLSALQARDILDAIQQVSYLTGLKYSPEQSLRIEGLGTRWEERDVRSLLQYLDRWTLFPYGRIDLSLGGLTPGSRALSRDSQSGKWRVEP